MRPTPFALAVAFAALAASGRARADEPSDAKAYQELLKTPSGFARLVGTLELGKGFRFNNPYRLESELGKTAASLSTTATYLDLGAAVAFGKPFGLEHGAALHLSFALGGVPQEVLVPAYFAALPLGARGLAYGRVGPAIILQPDANVGGEAAIGGVFFLTGMLGVGGEVLGDLFYGAATLDKKITTYPILSAQLGIVVQHEVLP